MTNHVLPVPAWCVETQSFAEHEAWARQIGCCSRPGAGCKCHYYGALDLAPPWGQMNNDIPVLASASGVVSIQDQGKTGYGLHVRVQVSPTELVILAHLARTTVKNGQHVRAGEQVGWMGSTGNSTGKHVHWEIRINGIPVDPRTQMGGQPQPVPDPPPIEPPPIEQLPEGLPEFPDLPRARVTVSALNMRKGPGVTAPRVGWLNQGDVVYVVGATQLGSDIWLRIGHEQWVAYIYQGERYLEWV